MKKKKQNEVNVMEGVFSERELYGQLELIELLELVNKATKDTMLNKERLNSSKELLECVSSRLNLSVEECIMLAVVIEQASAAEISKVAKHFNCSNIMTMTMKKYLDNLVNKRWLNFLDDFRQGYVVREEAMDALYQNKVYQCEDLKGLNAEEILARVYDLVVDRLHHDEDETVFRAELTALLKYNPEVNFVKVIKKQHLCDVEKLVIFVMLSAYYKEGESSVQIKTLEEMFAINRRFFSEMKRGDSDLFRMKVIEYACEDGVACPHKVQFSNEFQHELADGIELCPKSGADGNDIIHSNSVEDIALYYNPEEKEQVDKLTSLLSVENMDRVTKRIKARGLGCGFCCLFYGGPGTGKTETVRQLARICGRDIMQVDMSKLCDKYVGESEKNVKNIFSRYKNICKDSEHTPILLLNEADAIIGKRMAGELRSADKMENAIQNIILQEMETFDGIMIATTNLTKNIDPAFDRRFLYKIEFTKPSYDAKVAIWHSIMPEISEELTRKLAANFDLSGGQIKNVALKSIVDSALFDTKPNYADMSKLCKNEVLMRNEAQSRIGFM